MGNGSETLLAKFLMSFGATLAAIGIEHHHVVAALFGAAAALLWLRDLTARQQVAVLFGNVVLASYFAWPLVELLNKWFPETIALTLRNSNAAAFVLGLGGSFIVQGLVFLMRRFGSNPIETIKEIKS